MIAKEHKEIIKAKFAQVETKVDFLDLLNLASELLYKEKAYTFCMKNLLYFANPNICKKRYSQFSIKKKSGGLRIINAPNKGLKTILRVLNFVLQCIHEPHHAANGFVLEKSIVSNAKVHIGKQYVYNLDLKDFFHSFDLNRVKMGFYNEPFGLKGDKESLAFFIACLCTHPFEIDGEIKKVLPQGSPTSPTITNILCETLDRRLNGLAKRFKVYYTRYADDITFSSENDVFKNENFQQELNRIISDNQKLTINPDKTRLQSSKFQQEVTGLIVNEKLNVRRKYVKQIRMWLYYWEKYGYEKAEKIFLSDYISEKGSLKKGNPNLDNVIKGKLDFLKMVKGEDDSTYLILKQRLDKLSPECIEINQVLKIWETEGIERAMEQFYLGKNKPKTIKQKSTKNNLTIITL